MTEGEEDALPIYGLPRSFAGRRWRVITHLDWEELGHGTALANVITVGTLRRKTAHRGGPGERFPARTEQIRRQLLTGAMMSASVGAGEALTRPTTERLLDAACVLAVDEGSWLPARIGLPGGDGVAAAVVEFAGGWLVMHVGDDVVLYVHGRGGWPSDVLELEPADLESYEAEVPDLPPLDATERA